MRFTGKRVKYLYGFEMIGSFVLARTAENNNS